MWTVSLGFSTPLLKSPNLSQKIVLDTVFGLPLTIFLHPGMIDKLFFGRLVATF